MNGGRRSSFSRRDGGRFIVACDDSSQVDSLVAMCQHSHRMEAVSNTTDAKTAQRTLHQYGDRELWTARNTEWCLPLYVDWYLDESNGIHYGMVNPACALYPSQYLVLQVLLGVHDVVGSKERWTVPRKVIESLLAKAPGITPRYYYKWYDPHCQAMPLSEPARIVDEPAAATDTIDNKAESFLAYLSKARGIPVSMLRVVWKSISEEAPKWLTEHRGTLQFGFCEIAAVPLRINWKQVVAFKCKNWRLPSIFNSSPEKRNMALLELGMPGVLCSPQTIAITRTKSTKVGRQRLDYTLEIIPTEAFRSAVVDCESKHILAGHRSYIASFERTIEIHYNFLINALRIYLKKAGMPFARLHEGSKNGIIRFVPTSGKYYKVRGVGLNKLPVDIVEVAHGFSVLAEKGEPEPLHQAVAPVPALSDISSDDDDVRQREGSAAMDTGRQEGDVGVYVLSAGEGLVPRKPVLPEPAPSPWKPSGLDEEGGG